MKENSELQTKIFSLEQEIAKLKSELSDKYSNISMIRETESRVTDNETIIIII